MAVLSQEELTVANAIAYSQEITRIEVYAVKVIHETLPEDAAPERKSRAVAYLKAQCFPRKGKMRVYTFVLPVLSVWVDPFDDNICKLHLLLKHGSSNIEAIKMQEYLVKIIKEQGALLYTKGQNRMTISCDTTATVLRFGIQGDNYSNKKEAGNWMMVPTFDNKATALQALIDQASKQVTIGGLDLINLNVIADEFLEAIGFEKVPDQIGNGVPMWRGEVDKLAIGKSRPSWDWESKPSTTDSFVNILQEALQGVEGGA